MDGTASTGLLSGLRPGQLEKLGLGQQALKAARLSASPNSGLCGRVPADPQFRHGGTVREVKNPLLGSILLAFSILSS